MTNEIQRFDIAGVTAPGQFTLAFNGSAPSAPVAYARPSSPSNAEVQAALESLPTIGPGNVIVTSDVAFGYVLRFFNDLADQDLPEVVAQVTKGGATITVATVADGALATGGGRNASLPTPCTLHDLMNWLDDVGVMASGIHHQIEVTTDTAQLTVTYKEA